MTDTRGTFRLKNVRQDVLNNEYVPIPSVWLPLNQGVGYQKMYGPAEYKFNFSTTTTTLKSLIETLSPGKSYLGSTSNPTHAWFNGGEPGPVSTSSKITYATDTAADSPGTRLPTARSKIGAVAGQSHSYFLGGAVPWTGSAAAVSSAAKLVYASDTISDVPSGALAATGNDWKSGTGGGANAYIFRGDGTIPTLISNTQKITFANDTRASLPGSNMVQFNEGPSGTTVPVWGAGNIHSTTHCYYAGGNSGGSGHNSTVQKMAYASETWAVNPAKCSKSFRYQSGMTASSTQGCVAGGQSPNASSSVDLITFATDVWAREPSMDLPSYPSGGQWNSYTGQGSTSIHDSMHSGTPGLPTLPERWFDGASGSSYGVGFDGSGDYLQMASSSDFTFGTGDFTIEFYVNATNFTNRGTFYDSRPSGGSTGITIGHEATSGEIRVYMNAGHGGDIVVQSTDFTTGVWYHIAVTRSSGTVRLFIDGTEKDSETRTSNMNNTNVVNIGYKSYSSSSYNYLNGTISSFRVLKGTALYTSNFDRPITALTNISDTKLLCCQSSSSTTTKEVGPTITANGDPTVILSQTLPTGPPAATPTASSTIIIPASLSNDGYYIGGDANSINSQVLKLSYASETTSTLSANVPANVEEGQACNSATAGYAVGGSTPSRSNVTARVTMANDAIATVPGASAPNPVNNGEGVGTPSNGYIFCGATPSATGGGSQIFKITYSSESFANMPAKWTGPGSSNMKLSAYCNSTNGYMVGGELPSNYGGYVKYVFSTDTASTIPATLSLARKEAGGVGYEDVAGYVTGGNPATSRTDKLVYSTETNSRVPSADATWDDIYSGVINGNRSSGYWACSGTIHVEKLTYSSESYARVPGAELPGANRRASSGFSAKGNNSGKISTPNVI